MYHVSVASLSRSRYWSFDTIAMESDLRNACLVLERYEKYVDYHLHDCPAKVFYDYGNVIASNQHSIDSCNEY